MKLMSKILSLLLCAALIFSFAACTSEPEDETTTTPAEENVTVNITALKGPTGMGMSGLIKDGGRFKVSIASSPDEIAPLVIKGEADIVACPLNLASALYKKTNGGVKMIAVNTLGVLSVLENGDTVKSVADLKGKKIGATGQGSTPEYILNYILTANGIDPQKDVEITYYQEHAELATMLLEGKVDIAMLPEPNVTTVLTKNPDIRTALDLTEEWEKATAQNGSQTSLAQGCLIVRSEFLNEHPETVKAFLAAYKKSVEFTNSNIEDAAAVIESSGILPSAQIAAKAIPNCNIVYIDSDEMVSVAKSNLEVLFNANPASVGGAMPDDNFYYTGK